MKRLVLESIGVGAVLGLVFALLAQAYSGTVDSVIAGALAGLGAGAFAAWRGNGRRR